MRIQVTYKVYEARRKCGLTIRELEKISGVSRSQINKVENNLTHPTVYVLCKLAIALNVKPCDLYTLSIL